MIEFLKDHSTLLLALVSVVAAFGGTWLGSRIQAKSGLAQARAAREAAETAADATLQAVHEQSDRAAAAAHAAALRDQRTDAIADLLRATRELVRAIDLQYREPGDPDTLDSLQMAFVQARGTVELCAPSRLLPTVRDLHTTTMNLRGLAYERAESQRAMARLESLESHHEGDTAPLRRAVAALESFRVASDAPELRARVEEALRQVPQLSQREQVVLLGDCHKEPLRPALERHKSVHYEVMHDLIGEARAILGVRD
ncbi:hypothetical protein ACIQ9R_18135 [Streptomyces sp. NPDC094447]|uniref:hypothetical protein n=1 Tax=Streptomyces sp. NPDC094447 TaxID=3366062 RepID=UPI003802C4F6